MTVNTVRGKITANKDTLNSISIAFSKAAEKFKDEGYDGMAEDFDRVADEIYNALNNTGFYDK